MSHRNIAPKAWRARTARHAGIALLAAFAAACAPTDAGVPGDATQVRPLLPGMSAPAFTARRADGSDFRFEPPGLKKERLEKPVVLTFYRGSWCPYCSRYLAEMRHVETKLLEMGYEILFLSADRPEKLAPSLEEEGWGFTLLSDNQLEVARVFGVAYRLTEEQVAKLLEYGHDIEEASGETHRMLPVPATFIIGWDGIIQFQYANPNYKVRLTPEVLLAAAQVALEAT